MATACCQRPRACSCVSRPRLVAALPADAARGRVTLASTTSRRSWPCRLTTDAIPHTGPAGPLFLNPEHTENSQQRPNETTAENAEAEPRSARVALVACQPRRRSRARLTRNRPPSLSPIAAVIGADCQQSGPLAFTTPMTTHDCVTSKITGLPPATLISNSARPATPVHFFVMQCVSGDLLRQCDQQASRTTGQYRLPVPT